MRRRIVAVALLTLAAVVACSRRSSLYLQPGRPDDPAAPAHSHARPSPQPAAGQARPDRADGAR